MRCQRFVLLACAVAWACAGSGTGAADGDPGVETPEPGDASDAPPPADTALADEAGPGADSSAEADLPPEPGPDDADATGEDVVDAAADPSPEAGPEHDPDTAQSDPAEEADAAGDDVADVAADPVGDVAPHDEAEDQAPQDVAAEDAMPEDEAPGDAPDEAPPGDVPIDTTPPACMTAADFVGIGSWTLQTTDAATYCRRPTETGSLDADFPSRTRLTFLPGNWPLPGTSGTIPFRLPVCVELPDGYATYYDAGTLVTTVSGSNYQHTWTQALMSPSGGTWSLEVHLWGVKPAGSTTLVLDGKHAGGAGHPSYTIQLCEGACGTYPPMRWLDDCAYADATLRRHTVTFTGGQAVLDVRIGASMAGHEPSAFVHAEGALDGIPFASDEYFDLLYSPTHHHFTRNFGVLLPDGSAACGLRVENASPFPSDPWPAVSVTDCDLKATAGRKVTGYVHATLP